MAEQDKSERYRRRLKLLAISITLLIILSMLALAAFFGLFFAYLGSIDDPFAPRAPDYHYELSVTGLDGFTTEDGSAVLMLPLPGVNGTPLLKEGWWVNYYDDSRYRYHGMQSLEPVNTSEGQMLAARINPTDYYESYARVTPVPISPGQNTSALPPVTPERINKPWSFDDVHVIAGGGIGQLDYPTSAEGRQAVIEFLEEPLLPCQNGSGTWNYTTYVYVDPALRPLQNDSSLTVTGMLTVKLNHNKVNADEEGARRFEYHRYTINETIPAGVTGYLPVEVRYAYSVGV